MTHIAVAVLLLAVLVVAIPGAPGAALRQADISAVLAASGFYFLSHILRCIRLSFLAVPLLNMSVRTAVTLHLYTAPVALALPFKFGELFRVQQIYAASHQFTATLVMVVVERLLDACVLLAICIVLYVWQETLSDKLLALMWILIVVNALAVAIFVVAPRALSSLQRYIVLRHTNRRARLTLAWVDRLRATTRLGYDCIATNTLAFFLITVLIWIAEVAAIGMLMTGAEELILTALQTAIERLGSEWRWLWGHEVGSATMLQASFISFVVLAALFPVAAYVYARRLKLPQRTLARRVINEKP